MLAVAKGVGFAAVVGDFVAVRGAGLTGWSACALHTLLSRSAAHRAATTVLGIARGVHANIRAALESPRTILGAATARAVLELVVR